MKTFIKIVDKIETAVCMVFIVGFTSVLLLGMIFRAAGHPLNWCNDTALFMLAWTVFLGADVAFRSGRLVNVDVIVSRLPVRATKAVAVLVYLTIIVFTVLMTIQGIKLTGNVGKRTLEGIPFISYAYVAASVPSGFFLMTITAVERLIHLLKSDDKKELSKM